MADSREGVGVIDAQSTQARFSRLLRRHVGRGKEWSVSMLAEDTGIDERTIRAWRDGDSTPCTYRLLRLMSVLPESFAADLLEMAGLTAERVGE